MFDRLSVSGWRILERRRLKHGVVHHATIRRRIRSRGADTSRAVAPDLLKLGRWNISTVVGGNGGPKLVAAGLVDGAEAVSVNDLGLVSYLGVDAEAVEGLGGSLGSKSAWLGQEDLVLSTSRGGGDGCGPNVRAAVVAHWRAMTGWLGVRVVVNSHGICRRGTGGAARGGWRDRWSALAAVAAVRKLVKVQAASKLGLLEVCSDMLVWHLLHTGLKEVVFLKIY
jgi:hypothetical protein